MQRRLTENPTHCLRHLILIQIGWDGVFGYKTNKSEKRRRLKHICHLITGLRVFMVTLKKVDCTLLFRSRRLSEFKSNHDRIAPWIHQCLKSGVYPSIQSDHILATSPPSHLHRSTVQWTFSPLFWGDERGGTRDFVLRKVTSLDIDLSIAQPGALQHKHH